MKKLHRLVLSSFVGPFVLTFFISLFVLLMQFLWKYIDDLIGKGLEPWVVGELLFYTSANLVPLALPLAILVSSIMTFGNMAEHFEITAAKAAGISLQKLMRPLFIIALIISVGAFFFSNNVLPFTNLKMGSLLYDIRQQKPSLSIREGAFYNGLDGYSIKVGKKGKDGKTLFNVMIYDHTSGDGNKKVVIAESGMMQMANKDKYLVLTLNKGAVYEEQNKIKDGFDHHPLMRNAFDSYRIRFDLSSFKLNRTNEDLFKGGHQMMNMKQLDASVDTFQTDLKKRIKDVDNNLKPYFYFVRDTSNLSNALKTVQPMNVFLDTNQVYQKMAYENAMNQARSIQAYMNGTFEDLDSRYYNINKYKVEWHRKLTLSAACFILFLIGAPLGAIIRKGGLGLPLVISIIFFLIYHVTSITGEKMAKEGVIAPMSGMWLSSFVLLPIGMFLIYKATHDSALFDRDAYRNMGRKILAQVRRK
ncbi:MAG: LptF/LptG family permease [Bacteroidota bacterium]